MKTTALEQLLKQDNIVLPASGGAEKPVRCFNPHHEDKHASMSVNVARGAFFCHGCGFKGNAYTYLTEVRRNSPAQAMKTLDEMGMTRDQLNVMQNDDNKRMAQHNRAIHLVEEPLSNIKVGKHRWPKSEPHYDYVDETGKLIARVLRYTQPLELSTGKKPSKQMRPYTVAGSKFYCCGPNNDQLPEFVRRKLPIYNLQAIHRMVAEQRSHPDINKRQIWVVEGEKCAEAVLKCHDAPGKVPVTTLFGGAPKALDKHDLTCLYGQRILLIADADRQGRNAMKTLAKHLVKHGSEVRMFLPSGEDGYDVADAISAGGWTGLLAYIKKEGGITDYKPTDEKPIPVAGPPLTDTEYFRVLGQENENVIIQNKTTAKLLGVQATKLNQEGILLTIAPLQFWQNMSATGAMTASDRAVWADQLLRASEQLGELSIGERQMWGSGALRIGRDVVEYNLGNKVLTADENGYLRIPKPLIGDIVEASQIYLPGNPIVVREHVSAQLYANQLYDAVMDYRWEKHEHGQAFCGWIVTSLIGGCLDFRPMIWLTAEGAMGKGFLLDEVLRPLLGNALTRLSDSSEAGLATISSNSSLPVTLDEFEPAKGKELATEALLNLVRRATSGDAGRLRAAHGGTYSLTRQRFSLLASSINRPHLDNATESRFYSIRLSREGVDDWPSVRNALFEAVTHERCLAIRSLIITHTQHLLISTRKIEQELLATGVGTREAQIRAALSAGVRLMSGERDFILPPKDQLMQDPYAPMTAALNCLLRNDRGVEMTLAEHLRLGYFDDNFEFDNEQKFTEEHRQICERYGFRLENSSTLLVAVGLPNQKSLIRNTEFRNLNFGEYVANLPLATKVLNAKKDLKRIRFAGMRRSCVAIPSETLEKIGLFTEQQSVMEPFTHQSNYF